MNSTIDFLCNRSADIPNPGSLYSPVRTNIPVQCTSAAIWTAFC